MIKPEQQSAVVDELVRAMRFGSRNLEWGYVHIVEIGRGAIKVGKEDSYTVLSETNPQEYVAFLGVKLFGASGMHSVDSNYTFPEPDNPSLLGDMSGRITTIGFRYLFSLLPYFLRYRRCLGELSEQEYELILKSTFFVYSTELTPRGLSEESWQQQFGRPLMKGERDVRTVTQVILLREHRLTKLISPKWFLEDVSTVLKSSITARDWLFVEPFVDRFLEMFFRSAQECFDCLGKIAWALKIL